MAGPEARPVHGDRNLDAAPTGQVLHEVCVLDTRVDHARLARDDRVDDERAVLDAALQWERLAREQLFSGLRVLGEIRFAAPDVLVYRYVVALHELIVAQKVRCVLGVVFARLCDKIAEAAHQLEAHPVLRVDLWVLHCGEEARVGVLAATFKAGQPDDMVYARAVVGYLLVRHADIGGDLANGVGYIVAQTHHRHARVGLVDGPGEHAHRVRVVEQDRPWAQFLHLAGKVQNKRDRAQASEDPAYPHRVRDCLLQAVPAWNLEVQERGLMHPDLDHVHDEVSPFERPLPVEMFLDFGTGAELIRGPAGHHARGLQTLWVYIVQGDSGFVQLGEAQGVCQ